MPRGTRVCWPRSTCEALLRADAAQACDVLFGAGHRGQTSANLRTACWWVRGVRRGCWHDQQRRGGALHSAAERRRRVCCGRAGPKTQGEKEEAQGPSQAQGFDLGAVGAEDRLSEVPLAAIARGAIEEVVRHQVARWAGRGETAGACLCGVAWLPAAQRRGSSVLLKGEVTQRLGRARGEKRRRNSFNREMARVALTKKGSRVSRDGIVSWVIS